MRGKRPVIGITTGYDYKKNRLYLKDGYNETKFDEIRQWTAEYGDEEARRMYSEKYCKDKEQEDGNIFTL